MTRAEDWAAFKVDLAALLTREERCRHCQKGRRINDHGKLHHPRQCWAHMDQRFDLAFRGTPR